MKQLLTRIFASIAIATTLLFSGAMVLSVQPVFAQDAFQQGACQGANLDFSGQACDPKTNAGTTQAASKVDTIIKTVLNVLTFVVGLAAVIMIIIGGFKYITSNGDSGNVTGAKNTIMYALIGLVIVALAQVIVYFVLGKIIT